MTKDSGSILVTVSERLRCNEFFFDLPMRRNVTMQPLEVDDQLEPKRILY